MNGSHCTEDEIHSLIDGSFSAADQSAADHLSVCPVCTKRYELLLKFDTALKAVPLIPASGGFTRAVMSRLDLSLPVPRAFRFFTWLACQVGLLVVAAVLAGVFLLTGAGQPAQAEAGKSIVTEGLGSLDSLVAAVAGAVDGWLRMLIPVPSAGSLAVFSLTALVLLTLLLVDRNLFKRAPHRTR